MAMHGQIPVQFGAVFPDGAYAAGAIEMVRDFDRSTRTGRSSRQTRRQVFRCGWSR